MVGPGGTNFHCKICIKVKEQCNKIRFYDLTHNLAYLWKEEHFFTLAGLYEFLIFHKAELFSLAKALGLVQVLCTVQVSVQLSKFSVSSMTVYVRLLHLQIHIYNI